MTKLHRFHFKIDEELMKYFSYHCMYFGIDRSPLLNNILKKLLILIDEIDLFPISEITIEEVSNFNIDIIVNLNEELYSRLKYLHFRFGTFSIAILLRKLMRLYFIKFQGNMNRVLSNIKEFSKGRVWTCIDLETHMLLENNKTSRVITINSNYCITNILGFT